MDFYVPIERWMTRFMKTINEVDSSKFFEDDNDRLQKEVYFVKETILREILRPDLQDQTGAYNTMEKLTSQSRVTFEQYVKDYESLQLFNEGRSSRTSFSEENIDEINIQVDIMGPPGIQAFLTIFSTSALKLRDLINTVYPLLGEEPRVHTH